MTEILICGCTELFTEDALLRLAEEYRVVIAGPSAVSGNQKHITAYKTSPTEESSVSCLMYIASRPFTM